MIIIGGLQRLTNITRKYNSFNLQLKFFCKDDINIYNKIHTSVANTLNNVLDKKEYQQKHKEIPSIRFTRKSNEFGKFESINRSLSIASAIVDKAPLKFQPYMKLMRIDKPIGKYFM
jgi:hypothetical protein